MNAEKIKNLITEILKNLKNKDRSFVTVVFGFLFGLISFLLGELFVIKDKLFELKTIQNSTDERLQNLEILYLKRELERLDLEIDRLKTKENLTENDKRLLFILEIRKKEIENKLEKFKR